MIGHKNSVFILARGQSLISGGDKTGVMAGTWDDSKSTLSA